MTDEYTPEIGDENWLDRWQHPDGTQVLLWTTNRTAYLRAGLTLVQQKAYDYRRQMAADGQAARVRGTQADSGGIFPAVFPGVAGSPSLAPTTSEATPPLRPAS